MAGAFKPRSNIGAFTIFLLLALTAHLLSDLTHAGWLEQKLLYGGTMRSALSISLTIIY
jgi:hypothetical protein